MASFGTWPNRTVAATEERHLASHLRFAIDNPKKGRLEAAPVSRYSCQFAACISSILCQTVVFPDLLAVRFVDRHCRKRDLFLHLFAFDDLQSLPDAFRSRCCIEEGCREFAFANPSDAFVGQRINSEKLDVLIPASIFGGEIRSISDRVIVTVNQIDLVELLERGRHRVIALRLLPIAVDGL